MSKGKELAKNTIIIFIGMFFTKIIQYFLLPVYTGYLSTDEFGTYDLFVTIISLFVPILGLQIEQGVYRYLISNRNNIYKQKEYVTSSFLFVICSSLLLVLLCIIINPFITNNYKILVEFNFIATLLSSYFMQLSRGLGNNVDYSVSTVITSLATIIFNILFVVGIGLKIDGMLYGSTIGYIIGIVYLFFRLKVINYLSKEFINKHALKELLSYSLPMVPNTLSWWIFSSSDRVIVSLFIGLSATGLLAIAYKLSNVMIIIYNVFNMSLTESIALHINDEDIDEYFNKIYSTIGHLFTSFGSILISIMAFAFYILINNSYDGAYGLIPIAIIATEFQVFSGMLGTVYIAKNNTKNIAATSIIAAIVNVIVDLLLIKFIGVYAAVVSTVVSYLVLFIYRYVDVNKRYINIKNNKSLFINLLINIIVISLLYYCNNYIKAANIIIAVTLSILFNHKSISYIKKIIKRRDL